MQKCAYNLGSKPSIIAINYVLCKYFFGHASKISLHTSVFDKNALYQLVICIVRNATCVVN